jgi:putative flippase GtrA
MHGAKGQFLRFSLVTPFVGLTDFGVYYLGLRFLPHAGAKALSFACGAALGYFLNKHFTFRSRRRSVDEMGKYLVVQVVLLGVNVASNEAALRAFPGAVFPALVFASLVAFFTSFTLKKWWVFRKGAAEAA